MLESKDREINGAMYTSSTMVARRAMRLGTKLLKILGPSFGALGDGIKIEGGQIVQTREGFMSKAMKCLVDQIDTTIVETTILEILKTTQRVDPVTNKREDVSDPKVFDIVYAGNFKELGPALAFAAEVSLMDFLGESGITGLVDKAKALAGRAASLQDSGEQSTPTSSPS